MSICKKLSLDEQDYWLSSYHELVETIVYSAICFLIPFLIGHSQYITGIIVNAALVLAALNLKNGRLLPVILLPSIGVFSRGIIFGPFTMSLAYLIPFIWLGNLLLVYLVKRIHLNPNKNKWITLGISSLAKASFIFIAAFMLFNLAIIPKALLVPMGVVQLITAITGGMIAFGIQDLKKQHHIQNR